MRNKEARDLLARIEIKEPNEVVVNSWWGSFVKDYKEAFDKAIKALEQQTCDDAVSRQAVLNTLDKMDKALDTDRTVESYKKLLIECYKDLPPVIPKEKTGHWLDSKDWKERPYDSMNFRKHCSLCNGTGKIQDNFCPNCGARMVSE